MLSELFDTDELRLKKYFPPQIIYELGNPQRKILSIIETFGKISAKQIYYQSGYRDERGVRRILSSLFKSELVKRTGKSMSDPSAYYEINKQYNKTKRRALTSKKPLQLRLDIQ